MKADLLELHRKPSKKAVKMAQGLKALAAVHEDPRLVPRVAHNCCHLNFKEIPGFQLSQALAAQPHIHNFKKQTRID